VLKGQQRIELRKDLAAPARGSRREKRAAALATVEGADADLLAALKALRARLAQTQKVPAYVVFSDRTLMELATHRPSSARAMREIHGVGDAKLDRYGETFLEVIQKAAR
jgi:ATP-dependent DNA helicase RecQ